MLRGLRAATCALALAGTLGACGSSTQPPVPDACTQRPETLVAALQRAPAPVVLADGTPLSRCIRRADSDAELQNVGLSFHQTAERLRAQAAGGDEHAAVMLGYLVGATRSGAKRTAGVMAELTRRIELVAGRLINDIPALTRPVDQGLTAGTQSG
jgi:hypothetical protein